MAFPGEGRGGAAGEFASTSFPVRAGGGSEVLEAGARGGLKRIKERGSVAKGTRQEPATGPTCWEVLGRRGGHGHAQLQLSSGLRVAPLAGIRGRRERREGPLDFAR